LKCGCDFGEIDCSWCIPWVSSIDHSDRPRVIVW
jgi:hypothetical protein